ncbi:dTDP-6-deoxy-L-hexose 3-O-methyltransferase [Cohnella sp. CIP 111063]|uniref:TylF/MycF/NovP-related O-methyltransferase n=1 Tax=unclassified Cohnella TaxID=2636738 RepID=UPI000B8BC40C|nr:MULTISPECIES: TylF/MycF/NovP-related O-methyltransferase [unclassified Cohnella]OXS62299.1 dTDP-6-deoxy-L-hexose 3-O-methyltransferase [Cohnella sp. CIP 111063]PRX74530.1 macrocin-O-methyltransferase TylF [Cohnella sp. SGD-V74]
MSGRKRPMAAIDRHHSKQDRAAHRLAEQTFRSSQTSLINKLEAFPRFATKRSVARFLARYEIYRELLRVNGSIVECGVFNGAGFFSWAQFSNIFEPSNHTRKIIGFDTFEGFPGLAGQDEDEHRTFAAGDMRGDTAEQIRRSIAKYGAERHLSHIPNAEIVQGDFMLTAEAYLQSHPHLLVALLYLDFDLYEPTRKALELFVPRMPKGAIVCFDELNCAAFPGETAALLEMLPIRETELRRFPFDPWISYCRL